MNLEKFDEIERLFQRSFFFPYNNGGSSLIAAQKMPRCLNGLHEFGARGEG